MIPLLGVPWDGGNVVARGSCGGPAAIRDRLSCRSIVDLGDVERGTGEDAAAFFARMSLALPEGPAFILGGDHSISFTAVERLQRGDPLAVVWIDAHTDFSNYDGRAWHDHRQVLRRIAGLGNVERIVMYGHRGMTLGDERLTDPKLTVLRAVGDPPDLACFLPPGSRCYVSVDIDAIDPRFAPGTPTPVPGGLSPDGLTEVLSRLIETRPVVGIDLVEYSPSHDVGGITAALAASLVDRLAEVWSAESRRSREGDRRPCSA